MTDREKLIELLWVYCEIGDNAVEGMADCLIANGVTFATDTNVPSKLFGNSGQFKWISVEDEKPKCRGEYFVSYVFADCDMRFYGSAFWIDDLETNGYVTGSHFSFEGVGGMKVTHWMEIQKLPKVQEVPNGTNHV